MESDNVEALASHFAAVQAAESWTAPVAVVVLVLQMFVESMILSADGRRACDEPLRSWLLTLLISQGVRVTLLCARLAVGPRPRRIPGLSELPRIDSHAARDDTAGARREQNTQAARALPDSVYLPLFPETASDVRAASETASASPAVPSPPPAPSLMPSLALTPSPPITHDSPPLSPSAISASTPLLHYRTLIQTPSSTPVETWEMTVRAPLNSSFARARIQQAQSPWSVETWLRMNALSNAALVLVDWFLFYIMVRGSFLIFSLPGCDGGSYVQNLARVLVVLFFLPMCLFLSGLACLPVIFVVVSSFVEPVRRAVRAAGEEVIAALPTAQYEDRHMVTDAEGTGDEDAEGTGDEDAEDACVICLSKYEAGEVVKALPCGHKYHAACVDEWMRVDRSCPLCKRDVVDAVAAAQGGGRDGSSGNGDGGGGGGGGEEGGRMSVAV